jgi:L-2-hydroxyglutarate oxidase LhgO
VDYSHAVIGAGVVGLAVAAELSKVPGNRVILIEKNTKVGQETSSRNSEVIHAGLYYPKDSLKTRLCIEGKELIYSDAAKAGVEVRKVGKWIVAQNDAQDAFVESLHYKARDLGVKTELVSPLKSQYIEPAIVAQRSILSSPTTGILSAHSLMDYLESVYQANNGELAVGSKVTALTKTSDGYKVEVVSEIGDDHETTEISVNNVVNSAGLYADKISNLLLPKDRHVNYHYAKGTYFDFASSFPEVRRLIYPVPRKGVKGLGTHLTLSLDGQIRFGPDIEWVDSPLDLKPSEKNKQAAYEEIVKYFPHLMLSDLEPSYSGIRPKLAGPDNDEFQDFIIREEDGFPGYVNLLGIESPGLTSSIAIGKYVKNIYHGSN